MKEEFLFNAITDMKNYRQVFPEHIQSVQLIQNDLGNVADIAGSAKGFGYNVQVAYEIDPNAGKISQAVVKGDYSGTRMTTILTKTYGFDGTPEEGTKIHVEMKLKSSGWFSVLSFVSDEQIKFEMDNVLDKFIARAKTLEQSSGNINTVTTPTTTNPPIVTPSPSTPENPVTKPPVTTQPAPKPPVTKPPETTPPIAPITVRTDRTSYNDGDAIIISGTVSDLLSGYQISIQIFEPEFGEIVYVNQFGVGADKKYSHQLTAGGPSWFSAGEYKVVVTYGTQNRVAETTFDYGTKTTR